jgi:hypothetical protein
MTVIVICHISQAKADQSTDHGDAPAYTAANRHYAVSSVLATCHGANCTLPRLRQHGNNNVSLLPRSLFTLARGRQKLPRDQQQFTTTRSIAWAYTCLR